MGCTISKLVPKDKCRKGHRGRIGGCKVPRFAFEAVDRSGAIVRGALEAATQRNALDQLAALGHTPLSLRPVGEGSVAWTRLQTLLGRQGFDFAAFLRELAILLKAGLPVERALVIISGSSANAPVRLKTQQLLDRIRGGEPLSRAFLTSVQEAPPHIGRLLAAGEASGHLPEVMERLAAGLARSKALKSKLVSDLTYPVILILAMSVVLWVVFHTVLPRLTPMFTESGVALPTSTAILLAIGGFFDAYGLVLLLAVIAGFGLFVWGLKQPAFRLQLDRWLLSTKLAFGIPKEFEAALFCRNLETMLDGGLALERALSVAKDGVANRSLQGQIAAVKKAVAEGRRLSQAFKEHAPSLPPLVAEFAAVGEETGRLPAMMREVAEHLDDAVQTRLTRFTTLVVPLTTLIMGALVGGLMAGIVSGILAVNDLAH